MATLQRTSTLTFFTLHLQDALNAALAARDTVENHLQLSLDDAAAARAAMKAAQQQLSDQNDQTSGMLTQQLMQQISMPAQQQQLEEGSDVAQQRDQKQANEEGNADGAQQDSMPQQQELVHQVAQLQVGCVLLTYICTFLLALPLFCVAHCIMCTTDLCRRNRAEDRSV